MGIPGFFNAISKNYHIGIGAELVIKSPDVYLDFNSLIYTAKHIVGNILTNFIKSKLGLPYDQSIEFKNLIPRSELINFSNPDTLVSARDSMIFKTIGQLLANILIQTSNPSVHVYLDGVPHIGKMIEQRKRSLLGGLIAHAKDIIQSNTNKLGTKELEYLKLESYVILDKSVIKPGTGFMVKLETWIKNSYPTWTLDGFTNPGEAEHKIMNELINLPHSSNVIVYSPDADMIVLLLPLATNISNSFYLVRDSIDKKVYDLKVLVQDIHSHFTSLTKPGSKLFDLLSQIELTRLIYDVCFIYNIFGNDFLPKLDVINIYDKSTISRVLTQYIKYLNQEIKTNSLDKSFLTNPTESSGINWIGYSKWLGLLDKEFPHPIPEKSFPNSNFLTKLDPSSYHDQIWSLNNWGKGFYSKLPDKNVWIKDSFYSNTIFFEPNESIDSIVCDYCIGVLMIGLLYTKVYTTKLTPEENQILTLWYYQHHKAPLIQNICEWLGTQSNKSLKENIRKHLRLKLERFPVSFVPDYIFQLYYVIPRHSDFIDLVGQSYQSTYPELLQHKIYEQFISQLIWNKEKSRVNLQELVDCNTQRFIDKCVPLLKSKLNDHWINLIFDPIDWIIK